jgi:hypothetical protein
MSTAKEDCYTGFGNPGPGIKDVLQRLKPDVISIVDGHG